MGKKILRQAIHEKELHYILAYGQKERERRAKEVCCDQKAWVWYNNYVLLCILLYTTGLRINEALSLTADQIRDVARRDKVIVHTKKTESTREIKLSAKERQLWIHHVDKAFLDNLPDHGISNADGAPLSIRTASHWLADVCKQLHHKFLRKKTTNLPGCAFSSHSFRIGFVTRTAQGLSVLDAQTRVGHRSLQTTMRYCRTGDIDDVTARMDQRGL